MPSTATMHPRPATWLLVLPLLLQMVLGDQLEPQKCLEYCLKCEDNLNNLNVSMGWPLEVSLQVGASGKLLAQIFLRDSNNSKEIVVNEENVTLRLGKAKHNQLTVANSQPFSWVTLVLASAGPDTVLAYLPNDRMNVMTTNITMHGSLVSVFVAKETHVVFNCLSGCLIRDTLSALVSGGNVANLQPPFTMYLKPKQNHSIAPVLTLTSRHTSKSVTVNASDWEEGVWYRVRVLVGMDDQEQEQNKVKEPQQTKDGVMERQVWVPNENHTITKLEGVSWTLHCIPEDLINAFPSTASPDPEHSTEEASTSTTESTEGEGNTNKQKTEGGAGAGEVTAWVMAGLALFLVMVLALALCTKTARPDHAQHALDFQPSVGMVNWKGGSREPDEDSEPESPDELKVPHFHHSFKQPETTYKIVEE